MGNANKHIHVALSDPLTRAHRQRLDELLLPNREGSKITQLAWLRQSPKKPNSHHMLEHIERLKAWQALDLPAGIGQAVHPNRLLKIAREGGRSRTRRGDARVATRLARRAGPLAAGPTNRGGEIAEKSACWGTTRCLARCCPSASRCRAG